MKKLNIGGWGKSIEESMENWQKQVKKNKCVPAEAGYLLLITAAMAFCFFC